MNTWVPADLHKQFKAAEANGWLPFFASAAKKYNLPEEILLAIGSRETNLKNIVGDHNNGYGIMQIDRRSFPEWCAKGGWKDPAEAIRMGAWVLSNFLISAKRWLQPNDKYNTLRGALAAYNSGKRAFMNYIVHSDPDRGTTGHDYSRDVLERSKVFAELLGSETRVS